MFTDLMNFGKKRTATQAVGFYLAYLIVSALSAGIIGGLVAIVFKVPTQVSWERGVAIGAGVVFLIATMLSYTILTEKKMFKDFSGIAYMLGTGLLAVFGGGLLGLIIPAYLTTFDDPNAPKAEEKKEEAGMENS